MAVVRALDIFELLGQLDRKNYQLWDQLSEEQRKAFSPLVTLRWMAGTSDHMQIVMLNELINPLVFSFGAERKPVLMQLMTVCTSGRAQRYSWPAYNIKSSKKISKAIQAVAEFYQLNESDAEDTRQLFNDEEVLDLADQLGWQKDEVKDLKDELKKASK